MQQAWDKNGRIYYIDDNGNRVQPKTTKNAFERLGMQAKAGLGNLNRWLQNADTNSQSYKDKVNLTLGLLTAPIGGSSVLASKGAGALTPFFGRKIAQSVASNAVGGATGGAVEGFGRGIIENKNPLQTMLQDSAIGLVGGSAVGGAVGRVGKALAKRGLPNNPVAQQQYFADYVEGLSNNTPINKVSRFQKALGDFKMAKEGNTAGRTGTLFDSSNPLHVKQAELINQYNPKPKNSSMTWIENADDIYNFEDTLKDSDWAEYWEQGINPDYSGDMIKNALKTGEIEVYSSHPIDKGIFVTPSKMEAETYAGSGKVFSKRVPLKDVAWIDPTQGQYAPIKDDVTPNLYDKLVDNYNPEIEQIPLTETDAFKNWFGNSKVVDENGKPLVVYHGTNADFDTFDKSKIGSATDAGYVGQGFYGHIDKDTAKVYGKNVMPLYLKAENIYDFNNGKSVYDNYRSMGIEPDDMYDPYYDPPEVREANISKAVTKWLKDNNYDGAKLWGQYMVLEPEQIKSVNNQGTFDPTNPNIYKTIAPFGTIPLFNLLKQDNNQ